MGSLSCRFKQRHDLIDQLIAEVKVLERRVQECVTEMNSIRLSINSPENSDSPKRKFETRLFGT